MYYLRARYYDPSVGRFISKDALEGDITNPLSLNRYTYVLSNPMMYKDPTGKTPYTVYDEEYGFYYFMPDTLAKDLTYQGIGILPFGQDSLNLALDFVGIEPITPDDIATATQDTVSKALDILGSIKIKGIKILPDNIRAYGPSINTWANRVSWVLTGINFSKEFTRDEERTINGNVSVFFSEYLVSRDRDTLIAKYSYAASQIKSLRDNKKLYWVPSTNGYHYDPKDIQNIIDGLNFIDDISGY